MAAGTSGGVNSGPTGQIQPQQVPGSGDPGASVNTVNVGASQRTREDSRLGTNQPIQQQQQQQQVQGTAGPSTSAGIINVGGSRGIQGSVGSGAGQQLRPQQQVGGNGGQGGSATANVEQGTFGSGGARQDQLPNGTGVGGRVATVTQFVTVSGAPAATQTIFLGASGSSGLEIAVSGAGCGVSGVSNIQGQNG